jgi:hypothetical protein
VRRVRRADEHIFGSITIDIADGGEARSKAITTFRAARAQPRGSFRQPTEDLDRPASPTFTPGAGRAEHELQGAGRRADSNERRAGLMRQPRIRLAEALMGDGPLAERLAARAGTNDDVAPAFRIRDRDVDHAVAVDITERVHEPTRAAPAIAGQLGHRSLEQQGRDEGSANAHAPSPGGR